MNKAIAWSPTQEESLSKLLKNWAKESLLNTHKTQQIITQKNVDVDTLNQGARDVLRAQGRLGETEIICSTSRGRAAFSAGDRVQFTKADKEQGLMNGSFGMIEHIDRKTKMLTILLDNKETKEVNPDTYDGLRHGYAATVYKAQGATLSQVYVLHSNTTNQSTNYVALTRQESALSLYVSEEETPSPAALIHQMGRQTGKGTSLMFETLHDIEKRQEEKSFATQLKYSAETIFTTVKDIFHRNKDFYQVEKPGKASQEKAEAVVPDFKAKQRESLSYQDTEAQVSQKEKDQLVTQPLPSLINAKIPPKAIDAKIVEGTLKQNMSAFADDIFSSIGEPYNAGASSATERRYGKNGYIAVNLKTGAWIDHKDSDISGGPLHMLTKLKGLSFKEAVEYGASWAGLSGSDLSRTSTQRSDFKSLVHSSQTDTKEELDTETKAKIEKAQALWAQGRPIQGTLAERYLREHRKIEGELPKDLRYLPFFTDTHSKGSFPCLMAGARSESGEITAVQITFLNAHTAEKTDIPVAKRSFGVVKGSAVTLQEDKRSNILFVAEGVETGLSLKSAGIQGTIKASLGLSNIKRIVPESPQTQIVICADHDAPDSPAAKSLEKSVTSLQEQGLTLAVVKPDKFGQDFNDVLKAQGPRGVKDILEKCLPKDLIKIVPPQKPEERAISKEQTISTKNEGVFEQLTQQCVKKLYAYLGEERIDLTPDLIKRVESQAEKAANFIFHAHTLKGTQPTEKETKHFLLRAKYELDRIPEIRDELVHKWQQGGKYKGEKDEAIAHMIAERQASIEGRMYFDAKQKGLKPLTIIPHLAAKELKAHRAKTETLAQDLSKKHGLSETAATCCAKDILRHQETHGEKPSSEQMAAMVQISRDLDKQGYPASIGQANIEYLHRQDGDLQFREMASAAKDLSGFKDFPHKEQSHAQPQTPVQSYETQKPARAIEENAKVYEMELSM